jgi:hypothetical protein
MSDEKKLTIVQKSGLGNTGGQNLTYVENQHIAPRSYSNLAETQKGEITAIPETT